MSALSATASASTVPATRAERRLAAWWPLAALIVLAAALRLSTLGLQSFWFDEAFTVVHVLHRSLWATLRGVGHSESTPPLWYVLAWADWRVLGGSEVALRLPSALAGIATVPVAWLIGSALAGRRAAILAAALVAVGPLFVWYSQEARAYALFVLCAALAMLCFLRAKQQPSRRRMAAFALTGALAMLTHYFAVFLLIAMSLWLLADRRTRRAALPATGALALVGLALLPLVAAQRDHGTQWIGRWPLVERLQAIPQYYLTGYSGGPLGHGVELLVALPILVGVVLGLRWMLAPPVRASAPARAPAGRLGSDARGALVALVLAAGGVLIPLAIALGGADYLAPRNLVAAMIPVSALIAVLVAAPASGRLVAALGAAIVLALLAISIDVDLSPRLQRGDWRAVAHALAAGGGQRAIATVHLGAAPLEYYMPALRNLANGRSLPLREIDEIGYPPLLASAELAPARGFRLLARRNLDGLVVYRFVSSTPRAVSEEALRRHMITPARPEVLVPRGATAQTARRSRAGAQTPTSTGRI